MKTALMICYSGLTEIKITMRLGVGKIKVIIGFKK